MNKYVLMVQLETKESAAVIQKNMDEVKDQYDLTYKEYCKNKLYTLSGDALKKKCRLLSKRKKLRFEAYERITAKTGMTQKEIVSAITNLNKKEIAKINVFHYEKYELYCGTAVEQEQKLKLIAEKKQFEEELKGILNQIDLGEKDYTDSNLNAKMEAYCQTLRKLFTEGYKKQHQTTVSFSLPQVLSDEVFYEDVLTDMEVVQELLGFTFQEYLTFHFNEKSLEEKRTYLSNKERMHYLNRVNSPEGSKLLASKRRCYNLLGEYFQRKQLFFSDTDSFPAFEAFCKENTSFVKKGLNGAMGNGIELIHIDEATDLKALYQKLLEENGSFVVEELIEAHPIIKNLNPTSVNTVRLETYFDDEKVSYGDVFMRIGQNGAFVDNAGQGGIFVAVDIETGQISSDGYDEEGRTYITHPQTGTVFKGYQLPAWEEALALGKRVGDKVPGARFIGWDLAYTVENKWIVVEGNSKPQIIANQASQRKGLKKKFLSLIAANLEETV